MMNRNEIETMSNTRKHNGLDCLDTLTTGWKFRDGANCAPRGYALATNGKSLFSGEYRHAWVKLPEQVSGKQADNERHSMLKLDLQRFASTEASADVPEVKRPATILKGETTMKGTYNLNRETGKIELHFSKADYQEATDDQRAAIKSNFLFSHKGNCWVSRCKWPNTSRAAALAAQLGLDNAGKTGERLTYAEQLERQQERAEHRAERYMEHAANAAERAEQLQKPYNDMHGDIAFFTQPNINTSAGRAFTRRRERIFAAMDKGFEEFRKSEYWQQRAAIAQETADNPKLNDPGYLGRQIKDAQTTARKQRENITFYEKQIERIKAGEIIKGTNGTARTVEDYSAYIDTATDRIEAALDKLGFMQERLHAIGGDKFSRENVHKGDVVRLQGIHTGLVTVAGTGPKYITGESVHGGTTFRIKYAYEEIAEIVKPAQEHDQLPAVDPCPNAAKCPDRGSTSNVIDFAAAKHAHDAAQIVKYYENAAKAAQERAEKAADEATAAIITAMLTGDVDDYAAALKAHADAEHARAAAQDHSRAAEKARENAQPQSMTTQQLDAIQAHDAAKSKPTQNADGVRVGDLFVETFGYDMTINHFFQVVGLKGKRTAIIRRVASSITSGDGYTGTERAVRDAFTNEETVERRTSSSNGKPCMASSMKGRHMWPTSDFKEHAFNTLD